MRLTVVGSANAFNAAGRGHSCYWLDDLVRDGLMVDFGATALAGLRRLGRDLERLGTIALTHLHGDHTGGLPFLVVGAMYDLVPRRAPLRIVGPLGTQAHLEALLGVTYGALFAKPRPFQLTIEEVAPGGAVDLGDGARLEAFPAEHMDPPEAPLCLRLRRDGRSVAFSGDTRLCDGLRDAARGVDLLVAECTALEPPAGRHITWAEWRAALPGIGAREVLLTHLGDDVRAAIPRLLAEAPPGPRLAFADDGLTLGVGDTP